MSSENGDVGFLTVDRELVIRSWDDWLAAATGISPEVAFGRSLLELFPEVAERGLAARLRRVVDEGAVEVLAPAFHRYLIPCPPRQPTTYFQRMQQQVTLSPLRVEDAIVGVHIQIADVTSRRDRERGLATNLESPDERIRLAAVEALAIVEASPDLLVGAFDDSSWRVRGAAVQAVARSSGEGVVEVLTRALREQHRDLAILNATLSTLAASGEEVLPPLLELLRSPDTDLRVYVALALGLRGDRDAIPALVAALEDDDTNVRFHALEALGRLRARTAAPAIVEVVETRDFSLAFAALEALGEIGDESITPRILPLLEDELLRPAGLEALGRIGGEEAVAPIVALLDLDEVSAAEIATPLVAIYSRYEGNFAEGDVIAQLAKATVPASGAERLVRELDSTSGASRAAIARVVGWLELDGSAEALVAALADPAARVAAADGLVRLASQAVEVVLKALPTLDDDSFRAAARALGKIGSPSAVPHLLPYLEEDSPEAVMAVAEALGQIGDGAALEPLLHLLERPEAAVRQAAVGALSSIGHAALRQRLPVLLDSPLAVVRESAARIAGYLGYSECTDQLLVLCRDPEDAVRRAALEHLVYLHDPAVLGALREGLHAPSPTTRAAAVRAIARISPTDAVPLVREALTDPDLWVRYYAARAARSLELALLSSELGELARHDPAIPVRIAALEAYGALANDDISLLLDGVSESDPEVRMAALVSLAGTKHPDAAAALEPLLPAQSPRAQHAVLDAMSPEIAAALAPQISTIAAATPDQGVAEAAVSALLRADSPDALHLLLGLSALPHLRPICVSTLGRSTSRTVAQLGAELERGDEEARETIVSALAHVADPEAGRLVALALNDPSATVRRAAEHTLLRLDLRVALAPS